PWAAACASPQGQHRRRPPIVRPRAPCAAPATAGPRSRITLHLHLGTRVTILTSPLPPDDRPAGPSRQNRLPRASPHAAARLRVQARQRRRRYPVAAELPRAQEHSAHSPLRRAVTDQVQRLLERLRTSTMKKFFLSSIAALLLATGTTNAKPVIK